MKKKMECFAEWFLSGGGLTCIGIMSLIGGYRIPEEQWVWILFCVLVAFCFIPAGMFCFVEGLVKHIRLILKEEKEEEAKISCKKERINNDRN